QPEFVSPDRTEPPSAEWVIAAGEAILAGARAYGVVRHASGKWERFNVDEGRHSGVLRATDAAAADASGRLFVAGRGVLCRLESGRWTCDATGAEVVSAMALDRKGRLWVATRGGGLRVHENGRVRELSPEDAGLPSGDVRQVL